MTIGCSAKPGCPSSIVARAHRGDAVVGRDHEQQHRTVEPRAQRCDIQRPCSTLVSVDVQLNLDDHGTQRAAVWIASNRDGIGAVLDGDRLREIVRRDLERARWDLDADNQTQQLARERRPSPEHLDQDLVLL